MQLQQIITKYYFLFGARFVPQSSKLHNQTSFLVNLFCAAAERQQQTGEKMLDLVTSVCRFKIVPVSDTDMGELSQKTFLLNLYSRVMACEAKTGLSLLPSLKSVFQSVATAWIIDISERKASILLKELRLQSEKKHVVLKGCPHEGSEVRNFLLCLPHISQLRYTPLLVFTNSSLIANKKTKRYSSHLKK